MPDAGDLIGPYRLVSQLGKGAMGEVWRARDERLDRYVALKILPPDAHADLERRTRMITEAKAAAAIRHPNVVTLFDILDHAGEDILVMELVEGRTLSDTLRKDGTPGLEKALAWIEGIADALVAAHDRKILHRDIKAANIMVTDSGIKVLDFGLAKLRSDDGKTLPPPKLKIVSKPEGGIALDATMPSEPAGRPDMSLEATHRSGGTPREVASPGSAGARSAAVPREVSIDVASYRTHAGQLLGTPLYMAPEQVDGNPPDERSEVFSLGVLAWELLAGKPPYTATSMDELFRQITNEPAPAPPEVPDSIDAIVSRALAKKPDQRYQTMAEFRDAIAKERRRRFAPRGKRWPLVAALGVLLVGGGLAWWLTRTPTVETGPGDEHVTRALEEYNLFYNDKALSSLRAALARAPEHPRANAYMLLFGGASDADRAKAIEAGKRGRSGAEPGTRDRALLDAALAFGERGPVAARDVLTANVIGDDRELGFWAAEFDWRAHRYKEARDGYAVLLASQSQTLRGRIYDHYSSVLLYLDEPDEALRIGTLYRDAFPGEADAVGVYATTLAAAGEYPRAIQAAEEALTLSEGEDTLAGLAKVLALSGDRVRAKELYRRSLDRAGAARRPIRRAALALLQLADGETEAARQTVAPCLGATRQADPAGRAQTDHTARERGACLFVAGLVEPGSAETIAQQLDGLAAEATPDNPPYGAPASLATLVRARAKFFGGGCFMAAEPNVRGDRGGVDPATYDLKLDFYAAYHVPFFATYAVCEKAAVLAALGDSAGAKALLTQAARGRSRLWLTETAKRY